MIYDLVVPRNKVAFYKSRDFLVFSAALLQGSCISECVMHPSKETLNSPSSRVDADSTSRRRRILRCIFSGVGES